MLFLVFLWSFCSQFLNYNFGGGISNFVLLYLLGRYLRLYGKGRGRWYWYGAGYLVLCALAAALDAALYLVLKVPYTWEIRFFASDGLLMIGASLCFFSMFRSIRIKAGWIPRISGCMLGVYMIHEHPLVRAFYLDLFQVKAFIEQPFGAWLANFLFTTGAVFLFCLLVEGLRRLVLERLFEKMSALLSNRGILRWLQSKWDGTFWSFDG